MGWILDLRLAYQKNPDFEVDRGPEKLHAPKIRLHPSGRLECLPGGGVTSATLQFTIIHQEFLIV